MKCFITNQKEQFREVDMSFEEKPGGEMQQVRIYPEITYQEYYGIGGAFTEAAAYTYSQMSDENKEKLIQLYFGKGGNDYNFCRTHIQSCDFSLGNYAYVESADDTALETFSIERDKKYIIPFIKAALEKNEKIQLLASPWSPPAFMKTNGEMNHGGKLKKEFYEMWAAMISKYISNYAEEGIHVQRLTVQNEPAASQTWDSCTYTGQEEADFACNYLRPALDADNHHEVKINIWDHNKDIILDRVRESFAVEGAKSTIAGIAFHWYTGDHFEALQEIRNQFADKELIFTEGCVEYSRFVADNQVAHAEMYAHDMIGNFNAGMNGFIDWNLILDEKGGPNHVENYCDAPVMCDTKKDEIDVKLSYYYIGHFSRFLQPGAKRMLVSKYTANLETTAFINPDGSKVLILLNRTGHDVEFEVSEVGKSKKMKIEEHSIMTLCW